MPLKDLKPGTAVKLDKLSNEEHKTTPPGRFSEVKLVAELEAKGIGRPSTFSSIVSLIQDRGYVGKKGTQLYPTALGFAVARLLAAKFPSFTAYEYTARMEEELDEIAEGKQQRAKFLDNFWHGDKGLEKLLEELSKSIDFAELEQYSTIDLHNGYTVRFSRFGTFLQDPNGVPNEKGYLPGARIDDDADLWDYKDVELCKETLLKAVNKVEDRDFGILPSGEYKGWSLHAREGRFGEYLQATHPDHVKAIAAGKKPGAAVPKPINHQLPEGLTLELITPEQAFPLFADVKLPRWSPDGKWLVGIGKRGNYIGLKPTPKSRPQFRSPKTEIDPKTVSFEDVQRLWDEAAPKPKSEAPAKPAAKKPAAKPAAKKTPAKKPAAKAPAKKAPAKPPVTKK